MRIAIIGLGLLGGSLGLAFRENEGHEVYGIDANLEHAHLAKKLGLVVDIVTFSAIESMDVVILAVPVDKLPALVLKVLDAIAGNTLVFDVGSTKEAICDAVRNHPKRGNFVAMHPIAGTEFSGPKAAFSSLFTGKVNIICEQEYSDAKQLMKLTLLLAPLNMRMEYIAEASQHDKHIAYVSHLSHISSFMLGKTVLEIEKSEKNIFDMAGSGFESTVRLAKSSPQTWAPIFIQNKNHILTALDEYIANLQLFKDKIASDNTTELKTIMQTTNHIKTILNKKL